MEYYVYILRCADGTLYTGITTDLARRYAEHKDRGPKCAGYTKAHPVAGMEAAWRAGDRAAASRLEAYIKRLPKEKKERLIKGEEQLAGAGPVPKNELPPK